MSKSRDIADSAATINYIDTVTSNVQDQIDNIDPLPSQTGNNGLFLTTDGTDASWAEAGGGAWTLIETLSPSAASTIDVESFSSAYDTYRIIFTVSSDISNLLRVRFKIGGAYLTSGYTFLGMIYNPNNNFTYVVQRASSPTSNIQISDATSLATTYYGGQIDISGVNESAKKPINYNYWQETNSGHPQRVIGTGFVSTAGALEGLRLLTNSGTVTGKVYVYGLTASGA